jgi:tetraacyldisaccharide-1-P 4'-kinase
VVDTITFDDHHQYELKDIEGILGNIITTEKDAVKLQKFGREDIYALKLKINIDVEELLDG